MKRPQNVQIDVQAAKALAEWKFVFAKEVCDGAKRLAAKSGKQKSVDLTHFRMAAKVALQSLSDAIQADPNAQHEAA